MYLIIYICTHILVCGMCVQDRVKPETVVCEADGVVVSEVVGVASGVQVLLCPSVTSYSQEPD
jgi:hypothetical protein